MTEKQAILYAIHHGLTAVEIDDLATALSSCEAGRKAAGKAIARGRRELSDETRQRKADLIRARNIARANKNKSENII